MQQEDLLTEAKEFFETYKKEIGKSAKHGKKSVTISFLDIASFSHELAESILKAPEEMLRLFELALEEIGLLSNSRIRLIDLPQSQKVEIRNIRAKHLNQLIFLEGLIRQASDVRPQVINARFECPSCGTIISVLQIERKFVEPIRCSCGRKGGFRLVGKDMIDAQRIIVEESTEDLSGGEQPRRIPVFLKEDLVDPKMEEHTTPGSRVRIFGILKEMPKPEASGGISTQFDISIEANNILPLEESFSEIELTEEDEKQIHELATDPDLYKKLQDSIAPSVYGYEEIKEALSLQLFGGVRKKRSDNTSSRGDIHILLVGDPGVAKSVILKFISSVSPKGRYISGKGSSGAGLTATVVRDEFLRGWALEAGTMVLASKGIACLDELEKMSVEDRSSMHEAMEQQTVSISKANVQATLRAETSVLGAANPKLGRFDVYKPVAQQINLEPTLINRFDLLFILRDLPERSKDEAIATHVLLEHRHLAEKQVIDPKLLRKYIAYAKQKVFPELTDKAVDEIKKFYVELRNSGTSEDVVKSIPISARQLEAMIRLAEASAKARLSKKITEKDSKRAIDLMRYFLTQVGFDYETKRIDIDRISTGIPASERSRIILVREAITRLESRLGKLIPMEELVNELQGKVDPDRIYDIVDGLKRTGDIFEPRKGHVSKI
jgi:replicative DNA helicase Mcm